VATCSTDQRIKLFRKSAEASWELDTEWKAHDAPIIRLSFAHPLHGSLLASCSHDRTVRIWEEPTASSSSGKEGRWFERAILGGAKGSVKGVEFSPPNPAFGLRVVGEELISSASLLIPFPKASIATDGHVRVYTSLDPALSDWSTAHDVSLTSLPSPDPGDEPPPSEAQEGTAELANGGWGLSWCKEKWWGSVLATFSGTNPTVKVNLVAAVVK